MSYQLVKGHGDYTEIHESVLKVDISQNIYATYKEAELASNEYVASMQAYKCQTCGGIDQNCPDCQGSGWL